MARYSACDSNPSPPSLLRDNKDTVRPSSTARGALPVNSPFMNPRTAALLPMPSAMVSISASRKPADCTRLLDDCRISARSIPAEPCADSPLIDDGAAGDGVKDFRVEQPGGRGLSDL